MSQPGARPADAHGLRLDGYLPYRLAAAADAVSSLIARAYQVRFGLSIPQWRIVCVLAEDGPSSEAQLIARSVMDAAAVTPAVAGLLDRQLVSRCEPEEGGRLALTAEGLSVHGQIAPLALAYEAALIAGLSPDEVALAKRLLSRLQNAAGQLGGGVD